MRKIGDTGWIILKEFVVKCRITDVTPKQNPHDIQYYFVDEPIGHSIAQYEIFDILDPIIKKLNTFIFDSMYFVKFKDSRRRSIQWLRKETGSNIKYKKKKYKKDWFYINDLI